MGSWRKQYKYISIARCDDGSLSPNFMSMKVDKGFSVERYVIGMSNELLWAQEGLIEK